MTTAFLDELARILMVIQHSIIAYTWRRVSLIRAYTVGHRWFVTDSHFRNPLLLFMGTVLAS